MAESDSTSMQDVTGLTLIRAALIGGAVIFGAVFWFLMQQSGTPVLDRETLPFVRWGILALFAVAAVAILVIRQKWMAAESFEEKRSLNITGWALAEGMTSVGAIYIFLAANPAYFVVGLLAQLLISFVLLPIPRDA